MLFDVLAQEIQNESFPFIPMPFIREPKGGQERSFSPDVHF